MYLSDQRVLYYACPYFDCVLIVSHMYGIVKVLYLVHTNGDYTEKTMIVWFFMSG